MSETSPADSAPAQANTQASLARAAQRLAQARPFAKSAYVAPVLALASRLLTQPEGAEQLYQQAPALDRAGLFQQTDWDQPHTLVASLVGHTLEQPERNTVCIECINLLRLLAIANGDYLRPGFSAEQAKHYLTHVLAHNLGRVFMSARSEAARQQDHQLNNAVDALFHYLALHIGFEDILGSLCQEIWRILGERPIQVHNAKTMITQIAISLAKGEQMVGDARLGADRLISALFGPTQGCRDDPGLAVYRERRAAMDFNALQQEAYGFARAMHDVGLVSDYHADFLRWSQQQDRPELLADCLGLSSTGLDCLRCYSELINALIDKAIFPETAQSLYGLTMMLERGVLFMPPLAPGLWRQLGLPVSASNEQRLGSVFRASHPPSVFLLAGTISVLGQPLGIGQGNNPTCQAARAISMWSFSDPDYLLHLIAQAAQFDRLIMTFEGDAIDSADLPAGLSAGIPIDNDPVSTLLVPHLDRIYLEMGRRCAGRGEDPHCWVNPEFHGWWVGRQFAIAVDINTGKLQDFEHFVRHFFASYHPLYNGNQPVIHPQPAGLAVTDSSARFVGWHAITLLRVALDQNSTMRVYFYNPNNDSGQNWGNGVEVSTRHHGERYGESSLPFTELASRLYIFHDEPLHQLQLDAVPADEVASVRAMTAASWASDRSPV